MGLVVRLDSYQPVEWERTRRPAQGTVALSRGFNLVAWMGRDTTSLDRVALGIGRHVEQAGTWSMADQTVEFHDSDAVKAADGISRYPLLVMRFGCKSDDP